LLLTAALCATLAPVLHIPATAAALALAMLSAARRPDAAQQSTQPEMERPKAAQTGNAPEQVQETAPQDPAQTQATEAQEARPAQAQA